MPRYDDDSDLAVVQDRHVAVLGYGEEGPAHVLSLRDGGVDVRVGLPADAVESAELEAEGLTWSSAFQACEEADVVVLLGADPAMGRLYREAVAPNLVAGDTLLFSSPLPLRYGLVSPPDDVDVGMVQLVAPGPLAREQYTLGRGAPVLVAVHQDATGTARALTLAYAKAVGGLRAGDIETSVSEAAEASLFAQRAIVEGGLVPLVLAGFETLTGAGCSPEVAYLECVQRLTYAVERLHREGPGSEEPAVAVLGPEVRQRMRDALDSVRAGYVTASPPAAAEHPAATVGRELRAAMPWLTG